MVRSTDRSSTPAPATGEALNALLQLSTGYRVSQMIYLAARLGLADLLAGGPKRSDELAERTGTHPEALFRVLRGLAVYGVFAQDADGRFGLTPAADLLRTGVPGSVRDWVLHMAGPECWRAWGELLHSVTTGNAAFPHLYGMSAWAYREAHPDRNAIFNAAMSAHSALRNAHILNAYDFSGITTLVDVGGGHGVLLGSILAAHPAMRGILFDLPHVVAGAAEALAAMKVGDRCRIASGDFFHEVPEGGDAYVLSKIIHDWSDERSTAILRSCRRAMDGKGKLLLVEYVIPPGNDPHPAKMMDLQMLVMLDGGRERTEEEFRALLAGTGFTLTRVVPTQDGNSVIEGRPI